MCTLIFRSVIGKSTGKIFRVRRSEQDITEFILQFSDSIQVMGLTK